MVTTVFLTFVLAYIGLRRNLDISSPPQPQLKSLVLQINVNRLTFSEGNTFDNISSPRPLLSIHKFIFCVLSTALAAFCQKQPPNSKQSSQRGTPQSTETFAMLHLERYCYLKILRFSHFPRFLNILKCPLDKMGRGTQKHREFVPEMLESNKVGDHQIQPGTKL